MVPLDPLNSLKSLASFRAEFGLKTHPDSVVVRHRLSRCHVLVVVVNLADVSLS